MRPRRTSSYPRVPAGVGTTTKRPLRGVPLRGLVVSWLERIEHRRGIVFRAHEGGRIRIDNWRRRQWTPALANAGVEHRRIYDLRHTYATWSLAAGVNVFTLARRMGTSVQLIDRTYGHLTPNADDVERAMLDAFDTADPDTGWTFSGRSEGAA